MSKNENPPKKICLTAKWNHAMLHAEQYPCTVIEAPMGYGKTTFAEAVAARLDERIVRQKIYESSPYEFWRSFTGSSDCSSAIYRRTSG